MATAIGSFTLYVISYSESTIDAIQFPSPFSYNFQSSISSEPEFFCNAAN